MKYLVDTCVLSELRKRKPDPKVLRWLKSHFKDNLFYISAITVGELKRGIEHLDDSDPRKTKLNAWLDNEILDQYRESVVPYGLEAAMKWGGVMGAAGRSGKTRPELDAQIAASALVHDMVVVTRNVNDMAYTGVRVVNPFE